MYYDPAATGERIQNLRKDREVTQEQLAIDLNISDRYMRNLEKGEKVPSVAPQRTERNAAADSCYAGNAGRICLIKHFTVVNRNDWFR